MGIALGLGSFTFVYADGHSYLQNDPVVCANCHVMQEQLDAWRKSPHRAVAGCNDCHTPHHSVVAKYWTKAVNGFWHSFYFTAGNFPDPIRIRPRNRAVTERACRHCHEAVAGSMLHGHEAPATDDQGRDGPGISCLRCHSRVGHWTR